MNQSKTDFGTVNESQLLRFGIIPQMQFLIMDDEVIFRGFDKDVGDVRCSIQHPEFSRMLRAYYARLWRSATVLKDEKGANEEELQKWTSKL